jgi:glutathione S-transferase
MILYYAPNACSIAPHIALEETGVPFEPRQLNLATGDHISPEYLKVNPAGRVPVLVVGGRVVTEVPALLTYIASLKPELGLIPPPGTIEHARCFEWLGFLSSTLHVSYAQYRRPERFLEPGSPCAKELTERGKANTIGYYREVENRLVENEWAAGEAYSIADIYLFPFFTWAWRLELDIAGECPKWAALFEPTKLRAAVRRTLEREGVTV